MRQECNGQDEEVNESSAFSLDDSIPYHTAQMHIRKQEEIARLSRGGGWATLDGGRN